MNTYAVMWWVFLLALLIGAIYLQDFEEVMAAFNWAFSGLLAYGAGLKRYY